MRADEFLRSRTDHGHEGPVALDIHVDVAIEVRHVQQALDIVGAFSPPARDPPGPPQ